MPSVLAGFRNCQHHIPAHYREAAGEPLLVFKYDDSIGRRWVNTKKYADLSEDAMDAICTSGCNCHFIDARFKHGGHLLTASPLISPNSRLQHMARMGKKYRPSPYPGTYTSATRQEVQSTLRGPIIAHAASVERKVGMRNCMSAWTHHVLQALDAALHAAPEHCALLGVYPTLHRIGRICIVF